MNKMGAAALAEPGRILPEQTAISRVGPGATQIRVAATMRWGTDVHNPRRECPVDLRRIAR